eukprot:COSAG06_NODE_16612_length_990_cov_1.852974_2_plen_43_part_01
MVGRVVRLRAGRIPGPQRLPMSNEDPHGLDLSIGCKGTQHGRV